MHLKGKGSKEQHIPLNKTNLENVTDFKYLESHKTHNGICTKDVKARIGMAKQKMVQLNNIWKDRGIPKSLKVIILKTLIWM